MAIGISEKNEWLLKKAVASGKFPSEEEALSEAIRLMSQSLAAPKNDRGAAEEEVLLPPSEWLKQFDQLTASREVSVAGMDDSRESIYGDHGS